MLSFLTSFQYILMFWQGQCWGGGGVEMGIRLKGLWGTLVNSDCFSHVSVLLGEGYDLSLHPLPCPWQSNSLFGCWVSPSLSLGKLTLTVGILNIQMVIITKYILTEWSGSQHDGTRYFTNKKIDKILIWYDY